MMENRKKASWPVKMLATVCAAVLLFAPVRTQAAGWTPQPLPAASVDTTFGDARYINPAWMKQKVTVSYNGQDWVAGLNAFADMPVRLTNTDGKIAVQFLDTSLFQSYFGAINVQLTAMTAQNSAPIYDNGTGSYILQSGQFHYEARPEMVQWLSNTLSNAIYAGPCKDISIELTPDLLTVVSGSSDLILSPDFVLSGSCTTSYATSGKNRSNNIAVAASRLNNMVIMPGQTVSVSDTILPRTRANGYLEAGVYLNGVHTTGLGGGVCQVSSTVYNAVMNAGLTVTERKQHSMPVSYLPLGLDAAIAAGSKDLKFRNDYTTPVVLQAVTANKKLTVNVLVLNGELNGRTYKLWAQQENSLAAKSYLTTYQNGQEVSTVFIASSKYKPLRESGE